MLTAAENFIATFPKLWTLLVSYDTLDISWGEKEFWVLYIAYFASFLDILDGYFGILNVLRSLKVKNQNKGKKKPFLNLG